MKKSENVVKSLKIGLASPLTIKNWAENYYRESVKEQYETYAEKMDEINDVKNQMYQGQRPVDASPLGGPVTTTATLDYRTNVPVSGGIFCERLFGPTSDWTCQCGRYCIIDTQPSFTFACETCGVALTQRLTRRYRMGYVKLRTAAAHYWFVKSPQKYLENLLYISRIERIEPDSRILLQERSPKEILKAIIYCRASLKTPTLLSANINTYTPFLREYRDVHNKKLEINYWPLEKSTSYSSNYPYQPKAEMLIGHEYEFDKPEPKLPKALEMFEDSIEFVNPYLIKYLDPKEIAKTKMNEKIGKYSKPYNRYFAERGEPRLSSTIHLGAGVLLQELNKIELHFEVFYSRLLLNKISISDPTVNNIDIITPIEQIILDFFPQFYYKQSKDSILGMPRWGGKYLRQRVKMFIKRLRCLELFLTTDSSPTWLILTNLPVIPPDLRPVIPVSSGKKNQMTSDLNLLYQSIIERNERISMLEKIEAPDSLFQQEQRLLQECVDALIDNEHTLLKRIDARGRELKSLTGVLGGKEGRFRLNLLGKRVDYSARSVIVSGPELLVNQCGLPYKVAIRLFEPFILYYLLQHDFVDNLQKAKKLLISQSDILIYALHKLFDNFYVLLNRAPTLHRLGVQAFHPLLIKGLAIKLHPLVCAGFNADFDGDQMAVHIPLSIMAQNEARSSLLSSKNILSIGTGEPNLLPSQDMVLGCYYLTKLNTSLMPNLNSEKLRFNHVNEIKAAYFEKKIRIDQPVFLRSKSPEKEVTYKILTAGQILFYEKILTQTM